LATARKHWFRVADSILREPWTRDVKLTMILLAAWLNQRWARDGLSAEEACHATLSRGALLEITGRSQLKSAAKSLRTLSEVTSISVEVEGEFVSICWPKFAEFQGLAPDTRENRGRQSPPPQTPPQDANADARKRRVSPVGETARAPPDSDALRIAELMKRRVLDRMPRQPVPLRSMEPWATDLERLHRLDGASWARIEEVFLWANADDFWFKNVLSPGKLRKQFARLEAEMEHPCGEGDNMGAIDRIVERRQQEREGRDVN